MKNIAIIVTSLNGGGAERIAGLLSVELAKIYNVYLFLLDTENIIYEYGGTIIDIGQSGPFYEYAIKVYKEKYDIDVAISFLEIMNFANIRTRGKERIIISERCVQSLIEPPLVSQTDKIKRYYNFADEIISCSEGVKYDLIHQYAVNNTITTIYNFINKEKIYTASNAALPEEAADFLGGSGFFLNVGRLHEQKNQKRLIAQFSLFHKTDQKNMKLLILGSGGLLDSLNDYIHELNMDEYIRIMNYTENPFVFMRHACSLIVSSHYEGLPNVVLEAMLLGCPVVATDCLAGPRELLMDEADYGKKLKKIEVCKKGVLVCDEESEDDAVTGYLAKAMAIISTEDGIRAGISKNAIRYMETYKNEELINKWVAAIENESKKHADALSKEKAVLKAAKHIVIYGAGLVGKSCYLRLKDMYRIDCFAVSELKNGDATLFGLPVHKISDLKEEAEDTAIIMGVGDVYQDDILNLLNKEGFRQIVYPDIAPLSFDYYANNKELDIEKELDSWVKLYLGWDADIRNPKTFNEKIQWLKLHDCTPIKTKLADKIAVRDYVKEKIGEEYLIPLLGSWNSFDEIDFENLPSKFVLKCNHGSGMGVLICDKSSVDYGEMKKQFDIWMQTEYAYMSGFEMHYAGIRRQILAEAMLETDDGSDLMDYKVFVFNGMVKLIQVDIDRHHIHRRNLYTPDWEYLPYTILYPTAPEIMVEKPECLDELIELSERLGQGFIHVRADFYVVNNQIYFGEMTFSHGSGTEPFIPESFGYEMGSWMELN